MGRCYEFGVSITDGCDQAMVVPEEGGKCVCVGCGTPCSGRFQGCGVITSKPGHVPPMAPEWARTAAVGSRPTGEVVPVAAPSSASVADEAPEDPVIDVRDGPRTSGRPIPPTLSFLFARIKTRVTEARIKERGRQGAREITSPAAQLAQPAATEGISRDELLQAVAALRAEVRASRGIIEALVGLVQEAAPAIREALFDSNRSIDRQLSEMRSSSSERELLAAKRREELFQAYGVLRNEVLGTLTKVEKLVKQGSGGNGTGYRAPPASPGIQVREPSSSSAWLKS